MKKVLFTFLFAAAAIVIFTNAVQDPGGKFGYSGSPNENTCNQSGCHSSYALNSGSGSVDISSDIPNWEYTPGQVYTITVTPSYTGRNLFGFNAECLDGANNNLGTISLGGATDSRLGSITVGGTTRSCISHKLGGGATADAHSFVFKWTAPAAGSGDGTFYYVGLCANNNNNKTGDYVYSGTQVVTEKLSPSSINETANFIRKLSVYPNPASTTLNIDFVSNNNLDATATIYDIKGDVVWSSQNFQFNGSNEKLTADVSTLKNGNYIVEVKQGGAVKTTRLLVSK